MDSDNFEMAKNFFLDGLKYFQNQEFKDAELSFLKSLELVPNRASILNNLAATQIKLNKLVDFLLLFTTGGVGLGVGTDIIKVYFSFFFYFYSFLF